MRVVRIATALAVALLAGATLLWLGRQWHCNEAKVALLAAARAMEQRGELIAIPAAREQMTAARKCLTSTPSDADLHLLVRSYAMVLGDRTAAAAALRNALRYERRPELLLELGLLELDMHDRDAALRDLIAACTFSPQIHADIPYYDVRVEVFNAVMMRQKASMARGSKR